MARPRVLDEVKKREICALLTAGMQLHKVASYVGCHLKTIAREREECAEFDQRVRRALMAADLNPLEAMRRAAGTHWRAAAWMLDRTERQQDGRRQHEASFTARELESLAERVRQVIRHEVGNPLTAKRIARQIDDLFYVAAVAAGGRVGARGKRPSDGPTVEESMAFLEQRWKHRRATRDEDKSGLDPDSNAYFDHLMASFQTPPAGEGAA